MSVKTAIRRAEGLLPGIPQDADEDPRWQAIIVVGRYIESDPEPIWDFIIRWGNHPQEDLRDAIATLLLEHLLEYHFDKFFPRVAVAAETDRLFGDLFCRCWKLGQAELPENSRRFDDLRKRCFLVP